MTDITQLILDTGDKDPQGYVRAVQDQFSPGGESASLGIGSLKDVDDDGSSVTWVRADPGHGVAADR